MTKHLFLSFCCIAAMCLAGCGIKLNSNQCTIGNGCYTIQPSGTTVSETRDVTDFYGISTSSGIHVSVAQSDSWKVVVEADENVIRFVSTEVRGGALQIGYADNISIKGHTKTYVKVWCPEICLLASSSGAEIVTNRTIDGESLQVNASSGSRIGGALNYDKVMVTASSAARIKFSGECATYSAEVSSGAEVETQNLMSDRVYVNISSGAKALVWARDDLSAEASSGGSVIYFGNPAKIHKRTSSGGSVRESI